MQVTQDGQQIIVRVVHPGDLFGFAKALQRSDYPGTAKAATESVILGWPTDLWPHFVDPCSRPRSGRDNMVQQRIWH